MIQTIYQYVGDGTTTAFTGAYCDFNVSDLEVTVNNLAVAYEYNPATSQVTINPAPAGGTDVEIKRITDLDERAVVFTNATLLDAPTQNLDSTQLFYALQERLYVSEEAMKYGGATGVNWSARNKLIKLVADPVDNLDAVNKQYLLSYAQTYFGTVLSNAEGFADAASLSASQADTSEGIATTKAAEALASADSASASALVADASADAAAQSAIEASGFVGEATTLDGHDSTYFATATHNHDSTYAPTAKGVTNGDTHDHTGGDGNAILEAAITLADNTTNNVSTTKHGFVPKAPNNLTDVLRGDGAWGVPITAVKAWVNFDGTTCTARAGFNVSTITDGGVGAYVPNLSTAMPNTNSCVLVTTQTQGYLTSANGHPASTSTISVSVTRDVGTSPEAIDSAIVCMAVLY